MSNDVAAVETDVADGRATAAFLLVLLFSGLDTSRDSKSQQAPDRTEHLSRQLITFPILHGISV